MLQRNSAVGSRLLVQLIAVIAFSALQLSGARADPWETYETDIGGNRTISLPEGSSVQLNTATEVRVSFTREARRITLDRGEAFFHVAGDSSAAVDVTCGDIVVHASSAEFNVRARDAHSADVLVTEGSVILDRRPADGADSKSVVRLSAEQLAAVTPGRLKVKGLQRAKVRQLLTWRERSLAFSGETLEEVVEEFNRYNRKKLVVEDRSTQELQVAGAFPSTDPDSFARSAGRLFGLRIEQVQTDSGPIIRLEPQK